MFFNKIFTETLEKQFGESSFLEKQELNLIANGKKEEFLGAIRELTIAP